ncbi:putative quinol monooxygenase [Psychromonas sp. CNPT3]|uniref:putative quinol monooxygenase n=1 Tax=Psychromonas sp. CNPT3 TaxID=314282 RepID=UPI002FBDAC89
MYIDNEKDSIFIFHENWRSEQDLNTNLESSHIKECFGVIGERLDSVEISKITKVSV